jgi:hypothetical protein
VFNFYMRPFIYILLFACIPCAATAAGQATSSAKPGRQSETAPSGQNAKDQQGKEPEQNSIQETPDEREERMKLPHKLAPERLSVQAPEGDVPLGNPIEINLTFADGKVADLRTGQNSSGQGFGQGDGLAKIVRDEGYTKTIEIIPALLGPVDLWVSAAYSDNAVAAQTIRLNVVPSAKGLKRFVIGGGNTVIPLVVSDTLEDGQMRINPYVTYDGLEHPIDINDCGLIKFALDQPDDEGHPVVEVGKNCVVHALREGVAYIIGDFAGVTDKLKVAVYSKEDAPPGYRRGTP